MQKKSNLKARVYALNKQLKELCDALTEAGYYCDQSRLSEVKRAHNEGDNSRPIYTETYEAAERIVTDWEEEENDHR